MTTRQELPVAGISATDLLLAEATVRRDPTPACPTGFHPLDEVLDGGLHAEELVVLAGRPGSGKTVAMLQWARSAAMSGRPTMFISHEHGPRAILDRLLLLEIGATLGSSQHPRLERIRLDLRRGVGEIEGPEVQAAQEAIIGYGARFQIAAGPSVDPRDTVDIANDMLGSVDSEPVLFVDYMQKIPAVEGTNAAEALKALAVRWGVPVVTASAVETAGLVARRLRFDHLREASAVGHEADVVILLSEKLSAISKVHLSHDPHALDAYRNRIVFSIVKNRSGPSTIDLEFEKAFAAYSFGPQGYFVAEQLIDEHLYVESTLR